MILIYREKKELFQKTLSFISKYIGIDIHPKGNI